MASLIQLRENKDAIDVSASFESEIERKEIYLKYLIVNALNNQSFYVNIANSMFYSNRFYSATKLFDFYVNNNLFDLIVLKPDSSEMLFDANRDEIHANIYGYVVARLGADAKSTEILGYFHAADFDSVVMGHSVATAKLTPIENFANIEIIDNQLSLDDVSDRFFELLSMFMDNDISKNNLSELACLLYNSAELRHAFSQVGMFDKICADIASHPDIVEQHFGSAQAPFVENVEELPNLDTIDNIIETTENVSAEPVEEETTLDLDSIIMEEPQTEIQPEPETTTEDVVLEPVATQEEEISEAFSIEPAEDTAYTEQPPETQTEEETINNEFAAGTDEQIEQKEIEETKISDNLDEFIIDTNDLNLPESDKTEELSLSEEPLPAELDEFNVELTETIEDKIEEIDLDKLAEEQLSDIPEQPQETYDKKWEKLSLVTDNKETAKEETVTEHPPVADTPKIEANEELLDILDEVEDDVNIDDNEVISMLNNKKKTQSAQPVQPQPQTNNRSVTEELQSPPVKTELTVLYKPNTQKNNEFSTKDISTQTKNIGQPTPKKSKKKLVAVAAAAIIVLGVTSIATNFIIGGNSNVEDVASTQNEIEEDYQFPIEGDTEATNTSMPSPAPAPVANDYVPNLSSGSDTKIVSSSVSQHRGAAPVILKAVAWQVPSSITNDVVFNKYLQIAGKNIKLNLASDLLDADDFAYNNKIKVSMTVRNNTAVKNIKIVESSGSKNIDDLVLQSIKLTLKYINTPVMTADTGDKDIVLVISI